MNSEIIKIRSSTLKRIAVEIESWRENWRHKASTLLERSGIRTKTSFEISRVLRSSLPPDLLEALYYVKSYSAIIDYLKGEILKNELDGVDFDSDPVSETVSSSYSEDKRKFYLASELGNHENALRVSSYLKSKGWIQTYDWTAHAHDALIGKTSKNESWMNGIAINETEGVMKANILFMLLPGERGSHVELGIALASKKPVIILAQSMRLLRKNGIVCSFYYHPFVKVGIVESNIEKLAHRAHLLGNIILESGRYAG